MAVKQRNVGAYALAFGLVICGLKYAFVPGPQRSLREDLAVPLTRATSNTVVAEPTLTTPEMASAARSISESEFWRLVEADQVTEVIIASWSGKQLLAYAEGELLAVEEESEVEDLRDQMMLKGIPIHYPASEEFSRLFHELTDEEALAKAEIGSEGAVAGGLLSALAVGIADSLLELGGAVAVPALEVEGQSFFEKKPPNEVVAEDVQLLEKAVAGLERSVEKDFQAAEQLASKEDAPLAASDGTYYQSILGVAPDANSDEIKLQYRKLALKLHPATWLSLMQKVLSDPDRRAAYDQNSDFIMKAFADSADEEQETWRNGRLVPSSRTFWCLLVEAAISDDAKSLSQLAQQLEDETLDLVMW
eukprot:symbB.v1.2.003278.t1/scaffold184.1/size280901/6